MSDQQDVMEPTTALAPIQPRYAAVVRYSVSELVHLAQLISKAVTLPKALQEKPDDILAVMLAGRELGIGPMQSTRQIDIIQGQTAIRAELKLALARSAGHDIRPVKRGLGYAAAQCVTHNSHVVDWAVSRELADLCDPGPACVIADQIMVESWEGESGNRRKTMKPLVDKSAWQSWGFAMLWARAVSQLCREHCPEAVGGLYSAEELGADGEA